MEPKEKRKSKSYKTIVDATALSATSNPISGIFETFILGMSNARSLNLRLLATGLDYAFQCYAFGNLLDKSREKFGIKKDSPKSFRRLHDSVYTGAANAGFMLIKYVVAGETNLGTIAKGTLATALAGSIAGPSVCYSVEIYRDLMGIYQCARMPKNMQKQSPVIKKSLAALLTAASIGATALVYQANSYFHPESVHSPSPTLIEMLFSKQYSLQTKNSPLNKISRDKVLDIILEN